MILIVKLILAHIIGDFILQPEKWVKAKEDKKLKAWQLYVHILIHGIITTLLLANTKYTKLILCIMISHLIIDFIKLHFQKEQTKTLWFIVDQIAHIAIIAFLGIYWLNKETEVLAWIISDTFILITTAVLFLTVPMSITINTLIKPWTESLTNEKNLELKNAGKYIGILERILIFIFIITKHWEAVGFLLATKSVFRFGDLKESSERKLTEYILIGTLLSFGAAIIVALLVTSLL
ncbi:DUF3307 domain-containing protein [Flavobacterium sp. TP390]|uniref:DUF3307 domain-containing protein n=1 Tax=Flavobacterium profundi TaxID=1774945 RepID=A0A6I4IJJ6_9FLAO|nr:DUF3307 domain-containing protein [Flavobacterium profundi]MVO09893.1 DUF3307 domain-containing protein [Flavobacterium profundi]